MDDLLVEFLIECNEGLNKLDQDLVMLEKNPQDTDVLKRIFRAIHSVKGTCGMFEFSRLEHVAHAAEDVLAEMRDGSIAVSPQTIGAVLKAIDIIKSIMQTIETTKSEPAGDDSAVISELRALLTSSTNVEESETVTAEPSPIEIPAQPVSAIATAAKPTPIAANASSAPSEQPAQASGAQGSVSEQSLRVNVDVLDLLMNLVGELVLTRNQLVQLVSHDDESHYLGSIQQLNRITSGLQQSVMKTRMQPVGNAWNKLPRIVRDLSTSSSKQIDLKMTGQETEIDRQVLQAIGDPLIHCVRNSADHGIESAAVRQANNKPALGTISLNAFHEGGHIIIEIKDDGGGINTKVVKEKAVERGLVRAEEAEKLSHDQICRLIFEPGFSTASQVTEVSGRGVGMDVVRTNIEKIGGEVDLISELGVGTTVRIKIPLTLAIVSALIVDVGTQAGEVFAIPQVGVVELVRVAENNAHLVEKINNARVLKLREHLLPLIDLGDILGVGSQFDNENPEYSIVVAQVNDLRFGIMVREIFDTQEIVVKPVGRMLKDINLYTGSTILGDGRVIIILDMVRLATRVASGNSVPKKAQEASLAGKSQLQDQVTLLVFKTEDMAPKAVPLSMVSRLEEFPIKTIENVNGRLVTQYRGELLPLFTYSGNLNSLTAENSTNIAALIFSDGTTSMGLLVKEISDTVDEVLKIDKRGERPGVLGLSVVQGKATEIIDIQHFLQFANHGSKLISTKIESAA
jgi:two-component system chemotaxis sensor kinase CheA